MMYFSCDICGKTILPGDDDRFVVKIESYLAGDSVELTEADLSDDHMEEISHLLNSLDDSDTGATPSNFRFDLCPECHVRFVRDPLGKEQSHKLHFSQN